MLKQKYIIGLLGILIITLAACIQDKAGLQVDKWLTEGKIITSATFKALSGELQQAMKAGGVAEAVQYCNVKALPITDSLAQKYNATIKRTSDRIRNPNNRADSTELAIIKTYKTALAAGHEIAPQILRQGTEHHYYAPIITQGLCLNCHGSKTDMPAYDIIAELYPDDLATDYEMGELRGIWSVHLSDKIKQ